MELLYQWRAQDEQDDWYQGQPVSRESHETWFRARLHNPLVHLWIAEEDGARIGTARVDSNGELTITVAPPQRGRGLGTKITVAVCALAEGRVKASIDESNAAGITAAERAGFRHRPDIRFFLWRP